MQTAVIGFPRIGSLRELKFALERYFRKESSEEELLKTAKELRKAHWTTQKQAGIDYISSNDFSFYDLTLDTAVMLGIVPARYKNLKLSKLDTYFAMARGHQDAGRDVKALAMKKWFNTNYHYIVPEIEDDTVIALCPEKLLFAGLVNGKNIWKNHYDSTLQELHALEEKQIKAVLSTSCSLLYVPYTLRHEEKLAKEAVCYFAFAEEKLLELQQLRALAECEDAEKEAAYQTNQELFAKKRDCENQEVTKRLSQVTEKDYVRLPERKVRQQLQKEELALPEFPTTTIGSFPQTKDVKSNRAAYRKGHITEQEYVDFNKKKIAECVAWQEEIGLDVLVHGEYERNDMVEYFGESLGGFLFTEKAWVQSYGTRCVKPPIIWGDVYRKNPITVEWSAYAQSLTKKPMKGMLTGPVTILNWSFPREDISIKESISQIALAIRDEVLDLEASGIRVIQIDEAALREKLPLRKSDWDKEYLEFAIPAFRLTHSGVKADTQIHTHMCYSEFTDIIPAIDAMDADVITFEASRSDLQILDSLREHHFETEVGPGVYDIHSPRVPSVEEIVSALKQMLTKIERDKLWVNPDCGLKTRGVPETEASLENIVEAARQIRQL